jgi:hypothetical protein
MRYWSKIFVFAKMLAKIYAKHEEMSAAAEKFIFLQDDDSSSIIMMTSLLINYNVVIVTYIAERPVYPSAGHPAQLSQD